MSAQKSTEFGLAVSGLIGVGLLVAVVYFLTVARFAADAGGPGTPEEVTARIKPVGSVTLAGAEGAAPAAAQPPAAPAAADEGPGVAIYQQSCFVCHATGAAGAPKMGDKAAWEPRVAQGIDQLLSVAIAGKGAMPPRGTCATCSDDDLKTAIEYMLAQSGWAPEPAAEAAAEAEGMSGTDDRSSMEGMSGMSGQPPVPPAPVMEGMSGQYQTAPDGSIYLYPESQDGMSGMGGMSGQGAAPAIQ